jgi:hypothetical protein
MQKVDLTYLKPLVAHVMQQPYREGEWTVQGFGFLRRYFGPVGDPKRYRLNLWNNWFSVPDVSTIHDHPWHFKSTIVAGVFCNVRYGLDPNGITHHFTTIKTGEGGGMEKSPTHEVGLTPMRPELCAPGDVYRQQASEIHETLFKNGTVTLNERTPVGDGEHARVFWPFGTDWVDAIPRAATKAEVTEAVAHSIRKWF